GSGGAEASAVWVPAHPPSESRRNRAHRSERRICTARDVFVTADVFIRPFNDDRAKQESQIKRKFVLASCEALIRLPRRWQHRLRTGFGFDDKRRGARCEMWSA